MTHVFRYCYSTYIYVSYNEALGEWIKSLFFFFLQFLVFIINTKHANNTICTGMLFIAKWEKLYSSELFISFNRTKYFLKIGYNISKTLQHVFFNVKTKEKSPNHIVNKLSLYLIKTIKTTKVFPSFYMDKHVYKISLKE